LDPARLDCVATATWVWLGALCGGTGVREEEEEWAAVTGANTAIPMVVATGVWI
jgi:hypothetical protein